MIIINKTIIPIIPIIPIPITTIIIMIKKLRKIIILIIMIKTEEITIIKIQETKIKVEINIMKNEILNDVIIYGLLW